jgi:integrase
MGHRKKSSNRLKAKSILRLPDLEQSKNAVLNSLAAASSQESYGRAIEFICWYCRVGRLGTIWGVSLTPKAIWHIVKAAAKRAHINNLAPHDLRRTCARLCHLAGGELEQIQFLLGHASVQTTEHYLGCKQKLRHAVNDNLGLEDV